MSANQSGILAIFSYLDDVCRVAKEMRGRDDFKRTEVFSPTSYHELEEALGFKASPVRFLTLIGGLTGCVTGFMLCLLLDWDWPIVVGGKTAGLYSLPAYVVIGFELTILLGAFGTIFGMLFFGRLANPLAKIHDPRLTNDKFAVLVPGASADGPQASWLKDQGAEEIRTI